MIVYVDIVSRKIVSSLKLNKEVERIEVKRGDILPLSLVFVQDGASVALPTGILIAFCAKLRNNFTGPAMVLTQTFVKNESSIISYDGVVRFDGELLTEHMDQTASQDDDLSLVDLLLEITWTDTTAQTTETSNTIDLRVVNDVYKGNENMPIPPDDEPFVFPFGIQTNTIDPVSGGVVTIGGTLAAAHIHGNLAGNVYTHIRAGEALAKGDPVYVSGSHGSGSTLIPIVSKADAANAAKMPAIGIVDTALANNANGHMVIVGAITEFNTAAYPVNAELYVANGGGLTATPPAASSQAVGRVERSNANNGAFVVKVNGWASSGGNGAADARKLVRFGADGTIPVASVAGAVATTDPRLSDAREWTAATVTQSEAETGTATTRRAWTAERVRQAIVAWWNNSAFKAKLDGIASGATANQTDAFLLSRANHTGTQLASTISNFNSAVASTPPAAHTHGNITNAGAIGTTTGLVVVTTTGGVLTTQSRSGIDSRTSFPNSTVSAATSANFGGTLVLRGSGGEANFGVVGVSDLSASGNVSVSGGVNASSVGVNFDFLINRLLPNASVATMTLTTSITADRTITFPDASGTLVIQNGALGTPSSGTLTNCTGLPAAGVVGLGTLATQSGTFSGASSGTNTGDETGARIAALINAATEDTAIVDADQLPLTETAASGAFRRATFASVWTWITGKLAALTSITVGGAWNFSSTTRPTSSGTGATSANSLITRADAGLEIFLNMPSVRRMTVPNALASTGTAPTVAISSGIVTNMDSFNLSSAGGARLIEYPSSLAAVLPAFNQPVRSVVHGRFVPATTGGSGVVRIVYKSQSAPALADATNAIVAAGWGVEFYAAGGSYRARLFARPDPASPCLYSGSGTGAGTVALTAAPNSYMAVMLVNDGAGNLSMHLLSGQSAGVAQGRIPDTATLTWTGAIPSGDLTRTYNPSLLAEIANASTGTAGVVCCVASAMSSL